MLPLSSGELALMRVEVNAALAGTAVILTAARASDGQGGQTWTYAAAGTSIARLSPEGLRGGEPVVGERIAEVTSWILTLPAHTTIDEDDRVQFEGITYEVSEVLTRAPWELGRRVRLVEVD